jgi:hypothetical protein
MVVVVLDVDVVVLDSVTGSVVVVDVVVVDVAVTSVVSAASRDVVVVLDVVTVGDVSSPEQAAATITTKRIAVHVRIWGAYRRNRGGQPVTSRP